MTTLHIGFDSAWSASNSGAIVGVLQRENKTLQELGPPRKVAYDGAAQLIHEWQCQHRPMATIVLLDQPTIVKNALGQRPVENLVASPIGRRCGGVQSANINRKGVFGPSAPVWSFLCRFGGAANPLESMTPQSTRILETYPTLAIIALGWTLPDSRPAGRLPRYNPRNRKKFEPSDWQHVCQCTLKGFHGRGLTSLAAWIDDVKQKTRPCKADQDGVDACLCLLVALHLAERRDCLMVGNMQTGYMVVPHDAELREELNDCCRQTGRVPSEWVRVFQQPTTSSGVRA